MPRSTRLALVASCVSQCDFMHLPRDALAQRLHEPVHENGSNLCTVRSAAAAEALTFPIDFTKTRMQLRVGRQPHQNRKWP